MRREMVALLGFRSGNEAERILDTSRCLVLSPRSSGTNRESGVVFLLICFSLFPAHRPRRNHPQKRAANCKADSQKPCSGSCSKNLPSRFARRMRCILENFQRRVRENLLRFLSRDAMLAQALGGISTIPLKPGDIAEIQGHRRYCIRKTYTQATVAPAAQQRTPRPCDRGVASL